MHNDFRYTPFTSERESLVANCARIMATESDLHLATNQFLRSIGEYYGAKRAYVVQFYPEKGTLSNTYEWCAKDATPEIDTLQDLPIDVCSDWIKAFHTQGSFYVSSLDRHFDPNSDTYQILDRQNITSLMASPMIENGTLIGFLGVDDLSKNQDDPSILKVAAYFIIEQNTKQKMIDDLKKSSYTDLLTGLFNRNLYIEKLNQYADHHPESLGVIFIDINGLKRTNDQYGHKAGDSLLINFADRIKSLTPNNTYRIGGDEFVILYENISESDFLEEVHNISSQLSFDDSFSFSLGHTWSTGTFDIEAEILKADELMYASKQSYYKDALSHPRHVRLGIAEGILHELQEGCFKISLQPQVNIHTGAIIGAEALVYKVENGIYLSPDKLLPYYEADGIIRHIDFFVLEQVCQMLQKWTPEKKNIPISINFSRKTLMEPNILHHLVDICNKYHVSTSRITIEVTESVNNLSISELRSLIGKLKSFGFRTSLDDFGSQYSNLNTLSEIDFDEVKLDSSLVKNITTNYKSRIICQDILAMILKFPNTELLVEGIESQEQLDLLRSYGYQSGQGYYFYKPMDPKEFEKLI